MVYPSVVHKPNTAVMCTKTKGTKGTKTLRVSITSKDRTFESLWRNSQLGQTGTMQKLCFSDVTLRRSTNLTHLSETHTMTLHSCFTLTTITTVQFHLLPIITVALVLVHLVLERNDILKKHTKKTRTHKTSRGNETLRLEQINEWRRSDSCVKVPKYLALRLFIFTFNLDKSFPEQFLASKRGSTWKWFWKIKLVLQRST